MLVILYPTPAWKCWIQFLAKSNLWILTNVVPGKDFKLQETRKGMKQLEFVNLSLSKTIQCHTRKSSLVVRQSGKSLVDMPTSTVNYICFWSFLRPTMLAHKISLNFQNEVSGVAQLFTKEWIPVEFLHYFRRLFCFRALKIGVFVCHRQSFAF